MWCCVVLALPVLGLALFVVLPLPVALPAYLVILGISIALYAAVLRALRLPVQTGLEAMTGGIAHALTPLRPSGLIRHGGELWRATADEPIDAGVRVEILRVERLPEGLTVMVRRPGGNRTGGPAGVSGRAGTGLP